MKRAIVLFPKFQNIDAIQSIRERFDPLAKYIAPHESKRKARLTARWMRSEASMRASKP